MEISNLAFRLIIILIPGIITTLLIKNLTTIKNWDSFNFSIYTILFSGINYLSLQLLVNSGCFIIAKLSGTTNSSTTLEIWNKLTSDGSIPYKEVAWACVLSVFIGLLASLFIRKKILFLIAKRLRVSYKYGDENLFYHFMRSDDTSAIYLRDIENNLTYHGFVHYYSESENIREIVLVDVDIYSYDESKPYYFAPKVYLSQDINKDWIIELPNIKKNDNETNNDGGKIESPKPGTKTRGNQKRV